jgi:hypothetical protein
MTDYEDIPRNVGSHWDYYEDIPTGNDANNHI